jgi:deoxyribonuclease V
MSGESLPPPTPAEAVEIQNRLRHQVLLRTDIGHVETVAGVDVAYDMKLNLSRAAVALMRLEDLQLIATRVAFLPTDFPYIPGFLSFREAPVILKALESLPAMPDLLMVDGQGIAHPRRFGIAAHLGVATGLPSVGVAKSRLTGKYEEPGPLRGDQSPLMDKGEWIGTVLRSKDRVNPLFISPGHRVDHEMAVALTMRCLTKYRLPEPTRIADKISKQKEEPPPLL